jgi:hypothetical protein
MADDSEFERVRITYAEQPNLTLDDLRIRLDRLQDLMVLLDEPARVSDYLMIELFTLRRVEPPFAVETLKRLTAVRTVLERVHYNPVLEIVLAASAGATALLALWKKYSDARKSASEADIKGDEADVSHARSQATIQRELLNYEITQELRARWQQLVESNLVDQDTEALDRMLESAVREVLSIESAEGLAENKSKLEN